jgi:hypothetical protein
MIEKTKKSKMEESEDEIDEDMQEAYGEIKNK